MNVSPAFPAPARIVYIDHTGRLGGGEIALLNLLTQLDRRQFDPHVILLADGPLKDRLVAAGISVQIIPLDPAVADARKDGLGLASTLRLGSALAVARCTRRLAKVVREISPALVHTNSLKSDILGGLAARWAGIPVVWHVRDRISSDYLPPRVATLFRQLCRWIPHHLIANSAATLQTLGPAVAPKATVVHDGTPVPDELPAAPPAVDSPVIGLVGRLAPWKGQHILIQAAASVLHQFPHARFRLIGSALFGEQAYEQELRQQVEDGRLRHAVEFRGFRENVQQEMAQLDVVVHASVTAEPFGQVVIEAMALAKPVIATAGGGVLEIVTDGETGLLVPMNDAPAMAAAISSLLADPPRRTALGQRGRARVLERFTTAHVARNVQSVYGRLLHRQLSNS